MLQVVKCNNSTRGEDEPVCKSEQEINDWMKRKFILTIHNQKRFEPHIYGEDVISQVSHLRWHPIDSHFRTEEFNEIML